MESLKDEGYRNCELKRTDDEKRKRKFIKFLIVAVFVVAFIAILTPVIGLSLFV